jgi:hypothetical protein
MPPTRITTTRPISLPRWAVYVGGSYWGITTGDSYEEALAQAVRDIGTTRGTCG